MVSSAIQNPAAVVDEHELKKSAYSQLSADSYMCLGLTRAVTGYARAFRVRSLLGGCADDG